MKPIFTIEELSVLTALVDAEALPWHHAPIMNSAEYYHAFYLAYFMTKLAHSSCRHAQGEVTVIVLDLPFLW
jgi:hypothetical protein